MGGRIRLSRSKPLTTLTGATEAVRSAAGATWRSSATRGRQRSRALGGRESPRAVAPSPCRSEAEVDLFFEGVDFGDLNGDAVAEADDPAGAAADEMVARG